MKKIAIIGAGICGLTIANTLNESAQVTIFEKSRGVGGRLATRRATPYEFDHGAQFFKVRSASFKNFLDPMIQNGTITPWQGRFLEIDYDTITKTNNWTKDYPHYVGTPKMTSVAKFLSKGLDIRLNTTISNIKKCSNKLELTSLAGREGLYDWVIITTPPRQCSEILSDKIEIPDYIKSRKMDACYSLMIGIDRPINLDFNAAIIKNSNISWVSQNNTKLERSNKTSLLVHSTNHWANQHGSSNSNWVIDKLTKSVELAIGEDLSDASHKSIHYWRYANCSKQEGPKAYIDHENHIIISGDSFISGRVESAYQSAKQACLLWLTSLE